MIIKLPKDYEVLDLTKGVQKPKTEFSIGRYNEKRPNMYTADRYSEDEVRNIHMGLDIGAPIGTEIFSFADGEVAYFGYNGLELDYGFTLVTKHGWCGKSLFALWGHLSEKSLEGKTKGQKLLKDEVIAWVGSEKENGGWPPHLHFQLSYEDPGGFDMPGVVSEKDHEQALRVYPDPRLVLGPLYE